MKITTEICENIISKINNPQETTLTKRNDFFAEIDSSIKIENNTNGFTVTILNSNFDDLDLKVESYKSLDDFNMYYNLDLNDSPSTFQQKIYNDCCNKFKDTIYQKYYQPVTNKITFTYSGLIQKQEINDIKKTTHSYSNLFQKTKQQNPVSNNIKLAS